MHGERAGGQRTDRPVAHLPAVAARAVQDIVPPQLAHTGQRGQLVDQTGGDQQPPRPDRPAVGQTDHEAGGVGPREDDLTGDELAAVPGDLCPRGR